MDVNEKIKNRQSWVKCIVILLFSILLVILILKSPPKLDKINFSEILSLILSLFAIWLSITFYFKATETSNTFYDNTYKFTKEVSEILGRIEAGFGEQLKHLSEDYSGLKSSLPLYLNPEKTKQEISQEEEKLKKIELEKQKIIEEFAIKAKFQEGEKQRFIEELKEKDTQISSLEHELRFLRSQLNNVENTVFDINKYPIHMVDFIRNNLTKMLGIALVKGAPSEIIAKRFKYIRERLPKEFLDDLLRYDLIDPDYRLTENGYKLLRITSREISSE